MQTQIVTHPAITLYQACVANAYGAARERYPQYEDRIRRGALIAAERTHVQDNAVLGSKGNWYTLERDPEVGHTVCSCPDPHPHCKHRWAQALQTRAEGLCSTMLQADHQWVATDGLTSGVLHAERREHGLPAGNLCFVPYGGPHGYPVSLDRVVLGASCVAFVPEGAQEGQEGPSEDEMSWRAHYEAEAIVEAERAAWAAITGPREGAT